MAKAFSNAKVQELWGQYETLLGKKIQELKSELKNNERVEKLLQPIKSRLEKSCLKPLEAKNLKEFSQHAMSVLKVHAKKKKKEIEKKIGVKKKASAKSSAKTKRAPRKKTAKA